MSAMTPQERIEFSPITERQKLKLPDGARMILWPLLALEVWDVQRAMPRMVLTPPQGQPLIPTFLIGAGTNTVCGSASGGSSRPLTIWAFSPA